MEDVLNDLVAEYDRLERILSSLDDEQWLAPSGAPGWTVRDVVVHLAQTEEAVAVSLAEPVAEWPSRDRPLDDAVDARVRADTTPAGEVLERWRSARHAEVHGEPPGRDVTRWFSDASALTRYGVPTVNYGTSTGLQDVSLGENLDIDGLVKMAHTYALVAQKVCA